MNAPVRQYLVVYAVLMSVLVVTIGAAFLKLGAWHTPVALGLGALKAGLILLYFMQVRQSSGLVRLAAGVGFFWLAILLALTLNDYLTRA